MILRPLLLSIVSLVACSRRSPDRAVADDAAAQASAPVHVASIAAEDATIDLTHEGPKSVELTLSPGERRPCTVAAPPSTKLVVTLTHVSGPAGTMDLVIFDGPDSGAVRHDASMTCIEPGCSESIDVDPSDYARILRVECRASGAMTVRLEAKVAP
jgi:hypothetical protein